MAGQKTRLLVRVISRDAKVIGSLAGGCRITVSHRQTGEVLARGLQLGGSGDTEAIMNQPHPRFEPVYARSGAASFEALLELFEPTPIEVVVEGPLAYPQAMQRASQSTWLIPGEDLSDEGLIFTLHGFIVDIMQPESAAVFSSKSSVDLRASVRPL